jgi:hypothetical protein
LFFFKPPQVCGRLDLVEQGGLGRFSHRQTPTDETGRPT